MDTKRLFLLLWLTCRSNLKSTSPASRYPALLLRFRDDTVKPLFLGTCSCNDALRTHFHRGWFASSVACTLFHCISFASSNCQNFSPQNSLLGTPLLEMPVRPHSVWSDLAQFHAPWKHWLCLPLLRYTYLFMFALCWGINPIIKGICVQRAALRCRVSAVKSAIALRVPSQ